MKIKAVAYVRVSTEDQNYERQIDNLNRYAGYKDYEIVEVFSDKISGYSKTLVDRQGFKEMNNYVDKYSIKHILVSEISRVSRDVRETSDYIYKCIDKGISIHFQKEQMSSLNEQGEKDGKTLMILNILSTMAEEEAITLSYRIKSGKLKAARSGLSFNKKIYAYDKGVDKMPVINEEQAILVRVMFKMLLQGTGTRSIANYLNENYDTKRWTGASVHSILTNSFYCGERLYKPSKPKTDYELTEQELKDYEPFIIEVPAIVSKDEFKKAQEFFKQRKRFVGTKGKHVNPLSSFIKCECGAIMNQIVIESNRLDLYRCKDNCGVKSVNRPYLINEVRKIVEKNAAISKTEEAKGKLKDQLQVYKADIKTNTKEINRAKELRDRNYEKYLEEKITEDMFNKFEFKFSASIEKLTKENKDLAITIEGIKTTLGTKIVHYSKDLPIFKKQLLKILESVTIKKSLAVIKLKGKFKYTIVLHRGSELQKYNNKTLHNDFNKAPSDEVNARYLRELIETNPNLNEGEFIDMLKETDMYEFYKNSLQ